MHMSYLSASLAIVLVAIPIGPAFGDPLRVQCADITLDRQSSGGMGLTLESAEDNCIANIGNSPTVQAFLAACQAMRCNSSISYNFDTVNQSYAVTCTADFSCH
jgi:hypothetical protein